MASIGVQCSMEIAQQFLLEDLSCYKEVDEEMKHGSEFETKR